MPPILCIVGKSNVGKTTLLERLVAELKSRGYRVATVKHDVHGFDLDKPGKDSWRHAKAGSDAVVISSPQKLALIKKVDHDSSLDEVASLLGADFDIILTEGFKSSDAPKVEVHRRGMADGLLCTPSELVALATDEDIDTTIPQYSLDDIRGLIDLIEERFLRQEEQEETTVLFADGVRIPLSAFAQQIIARTLRGMISALRGVTKPRKIKISVANKGRSSNPHS